MYNNFSIEDAKDLGKKFNAVCEDNFLYAGSLTLGKKYEITIEERILSTAPLCSFESDHGKIIEAHLRRFKKVEDE